VVGQQAVDVAEFVATYSGRGAPKIPGQTPCQSKAIGTLADIARQAAAVTGATGGTTTTPAVTAAAKVVAHSKAKPKP
jgi:hypothetical protein